MNPFEVPGRPAGDYRPLCPWDKATHDSYYAPIDHTLAAFNAFVQQVDGLVDFADVGRLVLSTGPEGCGKSSLVHRCVASLDGMLKRDGLAHHIFDLSNDFNPADSIEARLVHICRRIVDKAELKKILASDDLKQLKDRQDGPDQFYPYLSEVLNFRQMVFSIVLPPSEVSTELSRYTSLVQRNVVFFAESSYETVAQHVPMAQKNTYVPIIHLSVGVLAVEDGDRFVEHYLDTFGQQCNGLPKFAAGTIRRLMEVRINGQGKTTVRELQMAIKHVVATALRNNLETIEYANFQDYYTESGRV